MSGLRTKVVRGSGLISFGTLATRVLGFVREILAAAFFGTGWVFDAFVVAFSVPNLFRRVLGEEMFERAFLPPFKRLLSEGREAEARAYLARIFVLAAAALVVVTLVVLPLLPWLVRLLAPGLDPDSHALAVRLARMLLPFLMLIGLASLEGAVLLFSDRKLLFAMAPAVTNLVVVALLVLLYDRLGIFSLVVAWLVGVVAAIAAQLPAVVQIVRGLPRSSSRPKAATVGPALRQGGHIFTSSVITKGVEVVDRIVASLIGAGAISSLYYAFRIIHLPVSIVSLALSRSIAPELSRLRGERDPQGFARLLTFGIDSNLMVLAPVVLFSMLSAERVVWVLYGRGSFGAESAQLTALAFFYFGLAILPIGLISLVNRVYSALEDNRIPLLAALVGGSVNVVLDLLLYRTPLRHGGIALASAIGLTVQVTLMVVLLTRFDVRLEWARMARRTARLVPGLVMMAAAVLVLEQVVPAGSDFVSRVAALGAIAAPGFVVYAVLVLMIRPRSRPQRLRVALTGGGTGGHVYPALAIHDMLERQDMVDSTLYLGVRGRAEELVVPRHGLPIRFIASAPYAGASLPARVRSLLTVAVGTVQSLVALVRFRPHLVVATGGYVSAPVIVAAFLLKPLLHLRIVVEEQNLVPGVLNKVASLLADVMLVSFRESAYFIWSSRCVFTGYPVRREYLETAGDRRQLKRDVDMDEDGLMLLVTGGSLGARSINRALVDSILRLREIPGLQVVHTIGLMDTTEYSAMADTANCLSAALGDAFDRETMTARDDTGRVFYRGCDYLHNLIRYQRAADLVITRAGAGSLAELMALGKAMLVVPKRGLPGDHQELNAIGIAESGAAEVLFEHRDRSSSTDVVDADELVQRVEALLADFERRAALERGAADLHFGNTEKVVAETVRAVLDGDELDVMSAIVEPRFVRYHRQFDHLVSDLDTTAGDDLYHRLYSSKIEEYLAGSSYMVVNRGIKLIGALRRTDLYPYLGEHFQSFNGFQKRNALIAARKAESFDPLFVGLIQQGLADSYYETRREAIALYNRFYREVAASPEAAAIHREILTRVDRRWVTFEVRAEAIRAAVRILKGEAFFERVGRFRWARNVRLREAVLDAVEFGLSAGLLTERERVRRFITRMLITTSQFRPGFRVRERFVGVVQALEKDP